MQGPRPCNEDCRAVVGGKESALLIVCDGMGGYEGGAESAAIVTDDIISAYNAGVDLTDESYLLPLFKSSQEHIRQRGFSEAGATVAMAVVTQSSAWITTLGDSRVYIFRNGEEMFVSHDNSYVQQLVDEGAITREQARLHPRRNLITACVSANEALGAPVAPTHVSLRSGDLLLIASDGVWEQFDANGLASFFKNKDDDASAIAARLSDSLQTAASDNASAIVARIARHGWFCF